MVRNNMQVLGNRILVCPVEEEKKEGAFEVVEVQDSFTNKGQIVQIGTDEVLPSEVLSKGLLNVGNIVIFAKYSPDTQEVEVEGKKYKIIKAEDILMKL